MVNFEEEKGSQATNSGGVAKHWTKHGPTWVP
jgi:hypothetical protein